MKNSALPYYQLVITCALKQELPYQWLLDQGVPVFTLKALLSGQWQHLQQNPAKKGILVIITGIGLEKSQQAVLWINSNVKPLFVLNIGTCGTVSPDLHQGDWMTPLKILKDTQAIKIFDRLPIPVCPTIKIKKATLCSVLQPITKKQFNTNYDCIDMEAFAQAAHFAATTTNFHCLKMVSDFADNNTTVDFHENLAKIQKDIQTLFSWLQIPEKPEISVIIPVYNRAKWIAKCIRSVLNQTIRNQEIIVVNDGSDDDTLFELEQFGAQIKVLHLNKNQGVSVARNIGIRAAQGKWLAFLDSDDIWSANKLYSQWQFLKRYPFYEIMQSEEIWIRNGKRVNRCQHHQKPEGWIFKPSLHLCLISPSVVLIKKELLEKYDGFDESFTVCEDYDLWLRLSRDQVVGLDKNMVMTKYGGHSDQLSQQYHSMDSYRVKALVKMLEKETDPDLQQKIKEVTKKKLDILINGAQKRNNNSALKEYFYLQKTYF